MILLGKFRKKLSSLINSDPIESDILNYPQINGQCLINPQGLELPLLRGKELKEAIQFKFPHISQIMYLRRDRLIRKQLQLNRNSPNWAPLPEQQLKKIEAKAHEQLSLHKIVSREMDYSKIEIFLLLSTPQKRASFYNKFKNDLSSLFHDQRAQKTFQTKWTLALKSNVMGCFNKIAKLFFAAAIDDPIRIHLTSLYADIFEKLLVQEKLSRIQEKFVEPFLLEPLKLNVNLEQFVGPGAYQRLIKSAQNMSKALFERQTPKTLTSNQFLKYCGMRCLGVPLPHEKYLHNQLLHAPNPKYLLPFRRKGTFLALTNQLLLKSNKLDMVGCQFWSYYEYEQSDLYERIRRAAEWGGRIDILLMLIKQKLVVGLERCLNLINEKVLYFSNRSLTEQGYNTLMSLVQTALSICNNHSPKQTLFENALEKVDIGQIFQHSLMTKESRLRPFAVNLLELYLRLLIACPKRHLRIKFVPHLAVQLNKFLDVHHDSKFTSDLTSVVLQISSKFYPEERAQFLYNIVEAANHEWESRQELLMGNQIALISPESVRLIAEFVSLYGFSDEGKSEYKVLKLQFYYILALNYKESQYIESKQKLSRTLLDINPSLSNNSVFNVLQTRKAAHDAFRSHLKTLYGDQILQLEKLEHEGLLAVIDEVITYRMQQTKSFIDQKKCERQSFYTIMTSLLQQVERLEHNLLKLVKNYFCKCRKTYWIEVMRLKSQDQSKSYARELITRDACMLIQGCVSANPVVADFSWEVLQEYIQKVPELAIYTGVLIVWAESISILYRKSNQQYESRSERLKGKWLVSGTPIPTERKIILLRLGILMKGLYEVVLRGHLIDNDYLGVRVQYLIRASCKSASFGFGWKYLKHLTNSYKDDQQFLAKQVLTNNSCSWFVNQEYFNSRLTKIKPEKILLDKYLIPLHEGEASQIELKKIFTAVQPQIQTQFVTIPPKSSAVEVIKVVAELDSLCLQIQDVEAHDSESESLEELYSSLFDVVSRVKMIYITSQNQALVFSQILGVCRRYTNFRLLEHTLLKIVPFFYCLNQFNWRIVQTLAEILHFVVSQLNITCRRPSEGPKLASSTFDARLGQFEAIRGYEQNQPKYPGSRHKILSEHQRRVVNLKLMYGELIQFFGSHMHVCIAKGYSLSLMLKVFSINFLLENGVLGQLPLQSIGRCLLSQLELVNVLKSALQKGETSFDESVVDNFYLKTLKCALLHFQREDSPEDELITQTFQIKQLKQRINFLIQICDYLRNDDFHQLSKKKLPRRNELFAKKENEVFLIELLDLNKTYKKKITNPQPKQAPQQGQPQVDLTVLRYSLLYLISEQIDKIRAYAYPQLSNIPNPYSLAGKKGFIRNRMVEQLLTFLTYRAGSVLVYNFLRIFGDRVENSTILMQEIASFVSNNPTYNYPPFLLLFVRNFHDDPSRLRELNYWRSPQIPVLLKYLSQDYEQYPSLQRYVTKVLGQLQADQILFYLPQIFQALTLSSGKVIAYFLLEYARKSACFAHQLIWLAKVQSKQEKDPHNKSPRLPGVQAHLNKLQRQAKKIIRHTMCQFSREERAFFKQVNDFYEQVTAISGKMLPQMPPADKKDIIRAEVEKIVTPKSAYLPFNPTFQVLSINKDSGTPMQSAAKCPFLLTFYCAPYQGPDLHFQQRKLQRKQNNLFEDSEQDLPQEQVSKPLQNMSIMGSRVGNFLDSQSNRSLSKSDQPLQSAVSAGLESKGGRYKSQERQISCIFKVFDDIRQDCLALQIIKLFLQIFERHNLGLNLFPYHTLSNRTGLSLDIGGIIEVVPNCVSRDSIGKTNEQSLYQFFLSNFGPEHNFRFQEARQNFIRSQAAYSVVSYILQVKDRHNGNILVDKEKGFLVHIDFGFILDISPANNLKFERADFKLTQQMIRIMGGSVESEPFQLYLTLVIKGFLLARRYHEHIYNFVSLMSRSGLPCFLIKSLENLESRFLLHLSEIEAAEKMREIVFSAADHWTTNWYDRIQWMQQKIYH